MLSDQRLDAATQSAAPARKRVLNVGSGRYAPHKLHAAFKAGEWREVRLDVDAAAEPDIVGSMTNLTSICAPSSFDAIWSSHMLEHLHAHEVVPALVECRRVLDPFGFALITCPDLDSVASIISKHGLDHEVYRSPAGPITAHDMLFGHSASIRAGNHHMRHNTGFTCARLGELLLQAGFKTALVKRGDRLDLWALALMAKADEAAIQRRLLENGLDMSREAE